MQTQQLQRRLPLIIAIATGILSVLWLNSWLKDYMQRRENEIFEKIKQSQPPPKPPERMGVALLATKNIAPQTPIAPEDLLIKEIPLEYIQPGAVTSLAEVIGQISTVPIAAGEQILRTKLLPPGKIGRSLSEVTPEGKRAVSVTVDNIASIINLIKPEDYVDVLALITPPADVVKPEGEKAGAPRLVTLFQDVKVLAVGGELIASPGDVRLTTKKEPTSMLGVGAGTITLALSPQEATLLSFVQEHGKIKLSLRSSEDTGRESVSPVDWNTLFQYLYPESIGAGGKQAVVEIYRGSRKEVVPLVKEEQ